MLFRVFKTMAALAVAIAVLLAPSAAPCGAAAAEKKKLVSDDEFAKTESVFTRLSDDAEFKKKQSAPKKFKTDDDFKSENDFGFGEVGKELTVKNYKDISKNRIGPQKKKTLIENVFYSPQTKASRRDLAINGEILWTGMYKRINRLDDNFTPATHFTDLYFWVDSKSDDSKRKEQFFMKVGAMSENGSDYDKLRLWLDDTYGKASFGAIDVKLGNLVESLGSGDNISFLDNINPRRYYKGPAGDYNRAKKAAPMIKTNLYLGKNINFECHVLPRFTKSDLGVVQGMWGSGLQKTLAAMQLAKGTIIEEERIGNDLKNSQLHFAVNGSFDGFDVRVHSMKLRETTPIVRPNSEKYVQLLYPEYRVLGVDGNVSLGGEYLIRYEYAWYQDKWFTGYDNYNLYPMYRSDEICGLLGIDRTFSNSLYINLQGVFTRINDFAWKTPGQKFRTESGAALRVQKGYFQDKYQVEFQGFYNQRTRDYLAKTTVEWRYSDVIKYIIGFHINDGGDKTGPLGEFHESNHRFVQMKANW